MCTIGCEILKRVPIFPRLNFFPNPCPICSMYCILLWIVWIVRLTLIMIEITMNGQNKAFGLSIKPIHIWHTYSLVSAKMQIYLRFSVLMNILLSSEYDLWNKINSSKGLNPVQIEILFKIWSSEIHFKLKFCCYDFEMDKS